MNENLLLSEYQKICKGVTKIYVVPLIDYSSPDTNYLFLLYKDFIEQKETSPVQIESLSIFAHSKIIISRLKNEKCILHYHWFEVTDIQSMSGMIWKIFCVSLFRLLGGKIAWTIHNKVPHHTKYIWLNAKISSYFAKIAHRLHVHCFTAIIIMASALNVDRKKFFVVPHPEYPAHLFPKDTALKILAEKYSEVRIRPDRKIFLMFGAIAEYKGIIDVVNIFKQDLPHSILIVAGPVKRWDKNYLSSVKIQKGISDGIFIIDKAIPEKDVPLFLNSADYLLFNYKEVLTSGGVQLALNYKKNIILPSMGCLQEVRGENIYSFDPAHPFALKETLLSLA